MFFNCGGLHVQSSCVFRSRCVQTVRKSDYLHKPVHTRQHFISTSHHLYQQHALEMSAPLNTKRKVFSLPSPSQVSCVHSECILGDKMNFIQSDPPRLLSTESSKPQSPSKRLSVSRGIKQLFQSATKFVRFLQR